MADREIQEALNKYQVIIQEQVEKQRSEIKGSKKPAAAGNNANVWSLLVNISEFKTKLSHPSNHHFKHLIWKFV